MLLRLDEITDQITRVVLTGALDTQNTEAMALHMSVMAQSRRCLIVDLAEVTMVSSSAIRALIGAAKVTMTRGGKFILSGPSQGVAKVLETTGCDRLMPITTSLNEALLIASTPIE